MTEPITIEDIMNIWICAARHLDELKNTDKKAAEDIIKSYNKFLKIQILKGETNE